MPAAKTLMIQGTASHAGKTLLVAGLARIMAQDGFSVAPFKSQNMSLNSFVSAEGGEMGRAQVVQAEAARVKPHTDMNPVLLKPTTDTGAQVVVQGKPVATMTAQDYHDYKMGLMDAVYDSLDRLRRDFQVVLIEGAGSPAEVNFRGRDIANMVVAEMAEAPVLLVGDIERGGVFAQLVGTMELLQDSDRQRVAGFIINKFRGDRTILEPGLDFLESHCQRPVLGVVPYVKDLRVEEEDSVGLPQRSSEPPGPGQGARALFPSDVRGGGDRAARHGDPVRVRILRLPRLSNFTDFDALSDCPGFECGYVEHAAGLRGADLIIIPGTKSTVADLRFLWSSGIAAEVIRRAQGGTPVIGICGGFQMLGKKVLDRRGLDGGAGSVKGLGLLDVETVFEPEKETRQQSGRITGYNALLPRGTAVSGYEIHMGQTYLGPQAAHLLGTRSGPDGAVSENGLVLGTYMHGFFDSNEVLAGLLSWFGMPAELPLIDRAAAKEHEYDRLAVALRNSVDIEKIYEIAGLA
ncbi:MAG: cobyric acid synthase [Thermoleophilia bacterium]|nr:cobyric acid synthase [Thermoleophilia bacterium]